MRAVVAAVALALAGCGGEPQGVEVTEARDPTARPTRPAPAAPPDTVPADSALFADGARVDSLRADSLRRDSVLQAAPAPTAPDFRAFWPRFRSALGDGPAAAARLADLGGDVSTLERLAVLEGPFLDGALGLTARDFRRDRTSRTARVVVGYDAGGAVVPQDEALTESSVTLRFEVVDGAYRLVGLDVAD